MHTPWIGRHLTPLWMYGTGDRDSKLVVSAEGSYDRSIDRIETMNINWEHNLVLDGNGQD